MKIVFFGLGSIGQRHARLIKEMGQHDLFAFRSDRTKTQNNLEVEEIYSWEEVDKIKPEIAFITNPTYLHTETAIPCAKRNMALFIEKPVDASVNNLTYLLSLVREKNISSYVAYVLRFHPVIKELKRILNKEQSLSAQLKCTSYLPEWRANQNHLECYSASRNAGGGVILDLSHEFDVAQYLFGPVHSITGKSCRRSNVTIDAEDYVDAKVHCASLDVGVILDSANQTHERTIEIKTANGLYKGNLLNGCLSFDSTSDSWKTKLEVKMDSLYVEQIHYFIANIDNPNMMNNLVEANSLFRNIVQFREKKAA